MFPDNSIRLSGWVAGAGLLCLCACRAIQSRLHTRYHRVTTRLLNKAVVVGGTELDTGRYVVLNYGYFSNRRGISDNWYSKEVFLQLRDLSALPVGQPVAVPSPAVRVLGYARATWYFEQFKHISGTVTRLNASATAPRLRIALRYRDGKQQVSPLLDQTRSFRLDTAYFRRQRKDYHGKYEDLRLALKEPAKVRELDLTTYAIQYEKRNGRESPLDTLYQRLGELRNLETLTLKFSRLAGLPPGLAQLKRLKKLDASYNDLREFPGVLYQLDSLRELNLEWNKLDSIPAEVVRLKSLRSLILSDNRLMRYPLAINGLTGLRELGLDNANLKTLPPGIGQLQQLEILSLEGFWNSRRPNQVADLAPLAALRQLRSLSLRSNFAVREWPEALYQLQQLRQLDLRENPIDSASVDRRRFPHLQDLLIRPQP